MRFGYTLLFASALGGCDFTQDFELPGARTSDSADASSGFEAGVSECDTLSDPKNCGACGHDCLGGTCFSGKCQPVILASNQGDNTDHMYGNGPVAIVTDSEYVYWANGRGEIMRIEAQGGEAERLARVPAGTSTLVLADQEIFFTGDSFSRIFRIPKNGGSPARDVPLGGGAWQIYSIAYAWDRIHWVALPVSGEDPSTLVLACPRAGCVDPPKEVWADRKMHTDLAVVGDDILLSGIEFVWGDASTGTRGYVLGLEHHASGECGKREYCGNWFVPVDTSEILGVAADEANVFALARYQIIRAPLHGSTPATVLASGPSIAMDPMGPAIDADYVYWTNYNSESGSIARCEKKGCLEPEILTEGQVLPRGLAVDERAVYWITGDGKVAKLAKPLGARSLK